MRQQDCGSSGLISESGINRVLQFPKLGTGSQIVHPGQYQAWNDLSPAVYEHCKTSRLKQSNTAVEPSIVFVVAGDRPDTEWCVEFPELLDGGPGVQAGGHVDQSSGFSIEAERTSNRPAARVARRRLEMWSFTG
jgi:hypothetical protein